MQMDTRLHHDATKRLHLDAGSNTSHGSVGTSTPRGRARGAKAGPATRDPPLRAPARGPCPPVPRHTPHRDRTPDIHARQAHRPWTSRGGGGGNAHAAHRATSPLPRPPLAALTGQTPPRDATPHHTTQPEMFSPSMQRRRAPRSARATRARVAVRGSRGLARSTLRPEGHPPAAGCP